MNYCGDQELKLPGTGDGRLRVVATGKLQRLTVIDRCRGLLTFPPRFESPCARNRILPLPPLQEEGTSREMRQGSKTVRFETPQEARFTRARRAGLPARAPHRPRSRRTPVTLCRITGAAAFAPSYGNVLRARIPGDASCPRHGLRPTNAIIRGIGLAWTG